MSTEPRVRPFGTDRTKTKGYITVEVEDEEAIIAALIPDHVVVCLGGLSVHVNGSPIFGCLVYGPFTMDEVGEKAKEIQRLEGGAVLIRHLVDLANTYRRMSAD
jgi:hypothetical protein